MTTQPPDSIGVPPLDAAAYGNIAQLIYECTGIRLAPGREYFVLGRLGALYRQLGCVTWGELPDRLRAEGRAGLDSLIQAAITPETRFFRDEVPFRAVDEHILPDLLSGKPRPAPLRIWSAACSTGQEPYSIAMAMWDRVAGGELELSLLATDICNRSLARARNAEYTGFDLARGLGAEHRARFFEEVGSGRARVRQPVRDLVRFQHLNLLREVPDADPFDLAFCRNVGIYFDHVGKLRLYRSLARMLVPGGYLLLGAAETLFPSIPEFETVYFERCLLFRRVTGEG